MAHDRRYDIGILAGSGPEAGADMWLVILDEWRHHVLAGAPDRSQDV